MKLPAYPRYKPSGVEWLGDVPEHWEVKRSDAIVSADRSQLSPERFADRDVFHYSIPVVQETGTGQVENGESIASAKQVVKKPVVLVSKLNPRKATICLAKPQAILTLCSTEFVALNADKCELGFLEYLTRSELFRQGLDSKVQSVTRIHQRANPTDIYKFWNAWPTLDDQRTIAAFLDREVGRVDRLVAKKRELIERLKEKRTALISRTVTRGLPPDAARAAGLPVNPPLKPSGVPWFDECPSHWRTKRLRHISDFIVVGVVVNPLSYVTDEGVVFLLGGDVREMRIDTTDCKRCSPESSNGPLVKSRLDAGDLVVVRVGYPGIAAVVPLELAGGNVASMMLVRKHPRFCSQWLAYAFNSKVGRDQVEIVQYGAAQKQFNISHAVDFSFPFPPLPEQAAIAAYLDEETAKLDALVGKVEEAVERLQEYRTALITAAVTGKIDVREVVTT